MSTLSSPDVLRRTGGKRIRSIVYDEATIARRVAELGREIGAAYPDGELLVLGLLKGSFIFLGDLVRQIERPAPGGFPGSELVRRRRRFPAGWSGCFTIPETDVAGKHILLVEDIIDSGKTLRRLTALLGERQPRSLAICALLDKQLAPEPPAELRFVGFRAPPAFLVGYGLDHAENYRHLPFIADLDS